MIESGELLNIKQASAWASEHLGKAVTPANISYLINYGRISKIGANGGTVLIALKDLIDYYEDSHRETNRKKQLGDDDRYNLSLHFN